MASEIQFYKYQGAGNDFILIDDRKALFDKNNEKLIRELCDRRFGVGGDGLMLKIQIIMISECAILMRMERKEQCVGTVADA